MSAQHIDNIGSEFDNFVQYLVCRGFCCCERWFVRSSRFPPSFLAWWQASAELFLHVRVFFFLHVCACRAEAWNCIFCYLEYYQDSVASEIDNFVDDSKLYSFGDRHIRHVAVLAGLQTAFEVRDFLQLNLTFPRSSDSGRS